MLGPSFSRKRATTPQPPAHPPTPASLLPYFPTPAPPGAPTSGPIHSLNPPLFNPPHPRHPPLPSIPSQARKALGHNDLILEVTRQLQPRFIAQPQVGGCLFGWVGGFAWCKPGGGLQLLGACLLLMWMGRGRHGCTAELACVVVFVVARLEAGRVAYACQRVCIKRFSSGMYEPLNPSTRPPPLPSRFCQPHCSPSQPDRPPTDPCTTSLKTPAWLHFPAGDQEAHREPDRARVPGAGRHRPHRVPLPGIARAACRAQREQQHCHSMAASVAAVPGCAAARGQAAGAQGRGLFWGRLSGVAQGGRPARPQPSPHAWQCSRARCPSGACWEG